MNVNLEFSIIKVLFVIIECSICSSALAKLISKFLWWLVVSFFVVGIYSLDCIWGGNMQFRSVLGISAAPGGVRRSCHGNRGQRPPRRTITPWSRGESTGSGNFTPPPRQPTPSCVPHFWPSTLLSHLFSDTFYFLHIYLLYFHIIQLLHTKL